jgi:single-strand DNA-binding protein
VFDTNLVIVGNVLAKPEWRHVTSTGSLVANFRVASTARRFDRDAGEWVDGRSLRVRVTAWRRLAENVVASLQVGDPVVVYGRLYTRDWADENENKRVSYELEAYAVGHDLAKGRGSFLRQRAAVAGVTLEDADDELLADVSSPLADDEAPVRFGDGVPELPDPAPIREAPETDDDLTLEVERLVSEQPEPGPARRGGRRPKREAVAA